ncbi:hypothetical protein BJ742DRAFT_855661 [Cladochytrium replicatum]|nr:hypothetical protein BJ742DRAFT_855661 [Cladochytrium replicatum]
MKKYGSKLLDAQDAAKEPKKPLELHKAVMEQAKRENNRMEAVLEECFAACKWILRKCSPTLTSTLQTTVLFLLLFLRDFRSICPCSQPNQLAC